MTEPPPNWQGYQTPSDDTSGNDTPGEGTPNAPTPFSLYPPGVPLPVYRAPVERRRIRDRFGRRGGALTTAGVFVLSGAGYAVVNVVESLTDDISSITSIDTGNLPDGTIPVVPSRSVDLLTKVGIADLNTALREATGSTRVLEVAIVRHSAFVTVADKDAPGGARIYQWDGTLSPLSESVSSRKPFDFTEVRGDILAQLCGDAAATCTVVVGRPLPGDRAWLTVVGNGGPKRTDLDGNPV